MITFNYLLEQVRLYKKSIVIANILAIVMTLISVPVPLFIPHLVDEVILGKEGSFISIVNQFIEVNNPVYYIVIVFILTILLRGIRSYIDVIRRVIVEGVIEDIRLEMRKKILNHLKDVSMSEYDILGSGAISSKMTTDIASVIKFLEGSIGFIAVQVFTLIRL